MGGVQYFLSEERSTAIGTRLALQPFLAVIRPGPDLHAFPRRLNLPLMLLPLDSYHLGYRTRSQTLVLPRATARVLPSRSSLYSAAPSHRRLKWKEDALGVPFLSRCLFVYRGFTTTSLFGSMPSLSVLTRRSFLRAT